MIGMTEQLYELRERIAAESATGCLGAGDYRSWAQDQGYEFCKVVDWGSSAGDWTFIVSVDGKAWYVMTQTNNWPRTGFTRTVNTDRLFIGPAGEVLEQILSSCR